MSSDKDTVPGLGFKDKEKALDTIKNLEGRDADYQKLAVKGLIGRAKRTLQGKKRHGTMQGSICRVLYSLLIREKDDL